MLKHSIGKFIIPVSMGTLLFIVPMQQVNASTTSFPGSITVTNPCTGASLTVHGSSAISINETPFGVFVYGHFYGIEGGYSANFYGRGQFKNKAASYKIKMKGEFDGASIFTSSAITKVSTSGDGLTPTTGQALSVNNICK